MSDSATYLRALLEWQVELGATEAICDAPQNRFEAPAAPVSLTGPASAAPSPSGGAAAIVMQRHDGPDPVAQARAAAAQAGDLAELRAAMAAFDGCELKKGARNLVFADGIPGAPVMIIGDSPGRNEDAAGKPFIGQAGQLLDRMFAAIGMGREMAGSPIYITNILPWQPPGNRDPEPEEIAMMMPFVERHVALVAPKVLVAMGNVSCLALLGKKGITRLRGTWDTALGLPVLPMFHPAYLLRNPAAKRDAWHDLLQLQAKLRG